MQENNLNLVLAIVLSIIIVFGWQYFFERPKILKNVQNIKQDERSIEDLKQSQAVTAKIVTREEALVSQDRIEILSDHIHGSIDLKGVRFDDITLMHYKKTVAPDSAHVELFSPSNTASAYFAELGWFSKSTNVTMPDRNTIFKANKNTLRPGEEVEISWTSPEKITFKYIVLLDNNYMFNIKQSVSNSSNMPITMQQYGLVNRIYDHQEKAMQILHLGPIATIDEKLVDMTYDDIKDKKQYKVANAKVDWIGITDKYWLSAFVPDQDYKYNASYTYTVADGADKYQIDFIGPSTIVEAGDTLSLNNNLFAGAKKVDLLDKYEEKYNIKLFDRSIDFGIFYVLTKPLFHAINFIYRYVGNFGVSILIITVIIKLLMFTLANKSYKSMKDVKRLQPEIDRLKSLYGEDKQRFNQEVMGLYKREKVNPASGCLPLLIQIPVFFALYKVLYVTIEMRQAPFYGWIKDLSAPDPTSIFNLFGMISFTPPSFLMIGAWPILMAITMFLQQRLNPEPADPTQAMVMKWMPAMFLFMFSSFPAGLLIYWTWNNILSIVQQRYITR